MLPPPGACGITFNMRIFGGVESQVDEYPWSALIKYQRRKFCIRLTNFYTYEKSIKIISKLKFKFRLNK